MMEPLNLLNQFNFAANSRIYPDEEEMEFLEDSTYVSLEEPNVMVSHIMCKEEGEFECPICYESIENKKRMTISCGHHFCMGCTKGFLESNHKNCPMCRYKCFLLETPDETQFYEMGDFIEKISEKHSIEEFDLDYLIEHIQNGMVSERRSTHHQIDESLYDMHIIAERESRYIEERRRERNLIRLYFPNISTP